MKFLLTSFFTLLLSYTALAQVEWGFFAGPQASSASYKIMDVKQPTKMKYGLQAGVSMKIPFESRLYFTPAVFYSLKGYKVTYNRFAFPPDANATDNNTRLHCFEIAPLLQVDLGAAANHFYIKAGPSMDVQAFGNEKFNLQSGGSVDRKMKFSFSDYGYVSFNFLAMLGYETASGFMIQAHYSLGLSSICNTDDGPDIKHRAFGISFGKYLHRSKSIQN